MQTQAFSNEPDKLVGPADKFSLSPIRNYAFNHVFSFSFKDGSVLEKC